jgi:uncharacterized tellurite resistance protein B-like protein
MNIAKGLFEKEYTNEQKCAIIGVLALISKADRKVHPSEMRVIETVGEILGVDPSDPLHQIIASGGRREISKILNTLDQNQKEWFIVQMHIMMLVDGKADDMELNILSRVCEDIAVTEDHYLEIIKKYENEMRGFEINK